MSIFDGSEDDNFIFSIKISEYIDDDMDKENNNINLETHNKIIRLPNKNKFNLYLFYKLFILLFFISYK